MLRINIAEHSTDNTLYSNAAGLPDEKTVGKAEQMETAGKIHIMGKNTALSFSSQIDL